MTITDPIADMLTRIRNGAQASHPFVDVPASKLKIALAKVLKEEGYIENYEIVEDGKFKAIRITLKYDAKNKSVITKLVRVSKPGLKTYSKAKNLEKVLGGLGIAVISTSKGLMTDRKARKENIGGEVLCYVY